MTMTMKIASIHNVPGLAQTIKGLLARFEGDYSATQAICRAGQLLGMERPAKKVRVAGQGWVEQPRDAFDGIALAYRAAEGTLAVAGSKSVTDPGHPDARNVYEATAETCTCEAGLQRAADLERIAEATAAGEATIPGVKLEWCWHRAMLLIVETNLVERRTNAAFATAKGTAPARKGRTTRKGGASPAA